MASTSSAHARAGRFCKVGENLYRYSSNGVDYAVFRDKGKLKWQSLTPVSHPNHPIG